MTSPNSTLSEELAEAERALYASRQAVATHGHQGITWACLRYDAERRDELLAKLKEQKQ